MKHLLSKKLNVVVSLVLVLALVLGVAPAAFAANEKSQSDKLVGIFYKDVVNKYVGEVYTAAYDFAVKYGVIADAIEAIDNAIKMVEEYQAQIPEVPEAPAEDEPLPEDWPEEIPEEVWDEVPELLEQLPPGMIEEIPAEMIEQIPPHVIEQIPSETLDQIPDSVLDKIPQDTLDQLPADLRAEIMDRLGRTDAPAVFSMRSRGAVVRTSSGTNNAYTEYVKYINQLKLECADLLATLNEFKAILTGDDLTSFEGMVDTVHYLEEELPGRIQRLKYLWAVIAAYAIDGVPVYDENTDPEQVREDLINAIEALVKIEKTLNEDVLPAVDVALKAVSDAIFDPTCTVLSVFLDKQIGTAEEVVDALGIVAGMSEDEIKARIEELVEEATHADYVITDDSYYVAFGNIYAKNSYVELLGNELGVKTLNKSGLSMTIEQFAEQVSNYKADIAKADLITLNFGEIDTFVNIVNNVAASSAKYDLDWAKYLGAEYAKFEAKVDKALDKIYAELDENGVDGKTAEAVVAAVEVYIYQYVVYAYNMDKAISQIKGINPEALIVVVGAYNPLGASTFEYKGKTINVGSYIDYLFSGFGAYNLGYAIYTGDITYVDAPDVEVSIDVTVLNEDLVAKFSVLNLMPSANGQKYIQERILNALNVTKNLTPTDPTDPSDPTDPTDPTDPDDPDVPGLGDMSIAVVALAVAMGAGLVVLISKRKYFI